MLLKNTKNINIMCCASKLSISILALFYTACIFFNSPAVAEDASSINVTSVTDQEQISYIVNSFQKHLNGMGFDGKIASCAPIINFVDHSISGHDYSYGANCIVDTGKVKYDVLMCDDKLIGKFTMKNSASKTLNQVTNFIQNNCPPGG